MQKKKGISLIVLVITIIVMIILAAAIILSLNNAGIIGNANKAVAETNLAQMKDLASMSWGTAYAEDARTLDELKAKIEPELENAVGEELDNYEVTVGLKGITVVTKKEAPEDWKDNVTIILDGVPIPKGFVASKALGENTKDEGFVIYEGTEEVNDENVEEAKRSRNQFVWVPVPNYSEFKRWEYTGTYPFLNNAPDSTDAFWEILVDENNIPVSDQDITYPDYISSTTQDEAEAMYASVKKYGGFYIARYEMGIAGDVVAGHVINKGDVYTQMNKAIYGSVTYDEILGVARSLYTSSIEKYGVISTLIYGVQWDSMLTWLKKSGYMLNKPYGNYLLASISKDNINDGSKYASEGSEKYLEIGEKVKANNEIWLMTAGSLENGKINNIYDICGNAGEVSMEKLNYEDKEWNILRGSASSKEKATLFSRLTMAQDVAYRNATGRFALYIK